MRTAIWIAAPALALGIAAAAQAADAVKPGRWQFTSQVQMPAMPQAPPPGMAAQAGGLSASHTACIEPDKAVPVDPRPECRVERVSRNGATVSWATACTTARGAVRSEGVAHYSGDTMEATLTTQIPQAGGRTMETHQRITGRYLGPCAR